MLDMTMRGLLRFGLVVVTQIKEVALRRARLVLGWDGI